MRARGECLARLLEQIFEAEDELSELPEQNPGSTTDGEDDPLHNDQVDDAGPASTERPSQFNDERALVLIGNGELELIHDTQQPPPSQPRKERASATKGGIDLPGFVRKRTGEIRDSLKPTRHQSNTDAPLLPTIDEQVLIDSSRTVDHHWINLYGKEAGETVLEAAMTWLARDIWPNADGTEGKMFTWSQTILMINRVCPGWINANPRFDQVIVVAGVLEDPYATSELVHRIPTLIRRFVNRFKRSRKVTSFETLESTMTVHGALKLLQLPTAAGASLTLKEIREGYKQQAMATHPDAGGDAEAMRRVNEAYQMLRELYRNKS